MRFRHFIVPSRRSRVVDGGRETRPATAALHRRYITVLGFIVYRHSFFFGPLESVCPAFVLFPVLPNRVPTRSDVAVRVDAALVELHTEVLGKHNIVIIIHHVIDAKDDSSYLHCFGSVTFRRFKSEGKTSETHILRRSPSFAVTLVSTRCIFAVANLEKGTIVFSLFFFIIIYKVCLKTIVYMVYQKSLTDEITLDQSSVICFFD